MKYLVVAFRENVKDSHCNYSLCFCNSLREVRKVSKLFLLTNTYSKIVYYSKISFINTK